MNLPMRVPGIIRGYDPVTRLCTVEIPGITDGSPELPQAEIEYPIGDKSANSAHNTEIEILDGDLVWLAFENGDARYPIITGYRNPRSGNPSGTRRWHHANIEVNGDTQVLIIGGDNVTIQTNNAIVNTTGTTTVTSQGDVTVDSSGKCTVNSSGAATLSSDNSVAVIAPSITLGSS